MQLDSDKLEEIRVIMMGDEDESCSFFETGTNRDDGAFTVSGSGLYWGKQTSDEGDWSSEELDVDEFLKRTKGKELTAAIFLGWKNGKEMHNHYTDWALFSKVIGVSEMVALSVKVPKNVARRFQVFADEEATRADILRKLICDYVIKKIKDNADSLIFQDVV